MFVMVAGQTVLEHNPSMYAEISAVDLLFAYVQIYKYNVML